MKKFFANLNIPVSIFREGKKYVAYSSALDLSTSGNNYLQVKNRFHECVNIFFEEIIANGTITDVLQDLGWEKVNAEWMPPVLISQKMEKIKI